MRSNRRRPLLLAATVVASLAVSQPLQRPVAAQAQSPASAAAAASVTATDLAETLQRFAPTLDAVDDYEKLLQGVEALRDSIPNCKPDAAAQSLGEALLWSAEASLQAQRDLARGRSAVDSCRLTIADDALQGLTEQRAQVAQMIKVFSGLHANTDASPLIDQAFDQSRWITLLRSDAIELADLARHLEESAGLDPTYPERLKQVRRLIDVAGKGAQVLQQALSCRAAAQPVAAVSRIVATIQPISGAWSELDTAVTSSRTSSCAAAVAAAAKTNGPSWLPAAAGSQPKQNAASVPGWVPTRETPATETATTRSADLVRDARSALVAEETQRIEEQFRRAADLNAMRLADAQRMAAMPAPGAGAGAATGGAAMTTALTSSIAPTQALALAQRRVEQQQQQRQSRGRSFLSVLGKVTGAVGIIAATGGLGAPVIAAANAVSAIASAATKGNAAAALPILQSGLLPLPPRAAQALSAAQAMTGAITTPGYAPGYVPGYTGVQPGGQMLPPPAYNPYRSVPAGSGSMGYLPPTPNEPFLGPWRCTGTNTVIERDGTRNTSTTPITMDIVENANSLMLRTETGSMVGSVTGGRAQFQHTVPLETGTCQLSITLLPLSGALNGNTSVSCATGEQISGTLVCQR
ncbi:MAG TPA: hypothetical protein VEA16_01600 [Vicinamibacterales bacterium]|nr:hypothetical protein [Vicinamibacterales bacterium]